LQTTENKTAKLDDPMTFCYGIDAIKAGRKNQRAVQTYASLVEEDR
jgi:hypothetical protein